MLEFEGQTIDHLTPHAVSLMPEPKLRAFLVACKGRQEEIGLPTNWEWADSWQNEHRWLVEFIRAGLDVLDLLPCPCTVWQDRDLVSDDECVDCLGTCRCHRAASAIVHDGDIMERLGHRNLVEYAH